MPDDNCFLPLPYFLERVLPELSGAPAMTHLAATYNWVGRRPPIRPTEIVVDDDFTQIVLHTLTPSRIESELPVLLRKHIDPSNPVLATIYVGRSRPLQMLAVASIVRTIRPDARFVIVTCECILEDLECILRQGLNTGAISHVVTVECSGSESMGRIRDAVMDARANLPLVRRIQATGDPTSLNA